MTSNFGQAWRSNLRSKSNGLLRQGGKWCKVCKVRKVRRPPSNANTLLGQKRHRVHAERAEPRRSSATETCLVQNPHANEQHKRGGVRTGWALRDSSAGFLPVRRTQDFMCRQIFPVCSRGFGAFSAMATLRPPSILSRKSVFHIDWPWSPLPETARTWLAYPGCRPRLPANRRNR